jgi:hypothetical protein
MARINVIQYITFATPSNATDFGDLTETKGEIASLSDGTKGLCSGGNTGSKSNVIDYINIASLGDAVDFGDLTVAKGMHAAASNGTRGVFAGGMT